MKTKEVKIEDFKRDYETLRIKDMLKKYDISSGTLYKMLHDHNIEAKGNGRTGITKIKLV